MVAATDKGREASGKLLAKLMKDETNKELIFNIAKKFRTTVEKLTLDNSASLAVSADGEKSKKSKKLVIY